MGIPLDRAKIIGIVSGKGGVGKTTLTANIGLALVKEFRKKVLVVDGNVTSANLGLHLGFLYPPTTLHDVLDDRVAPAQSVYIQESGLHVMPASLSIKRKAYYEKIRDKIYQLVDNYDLILIDGAAGVGAEVKAVMHACDELLIVTTPEVPSIAGAIKVIETAKELQVPVRGIVVNEYKRQKFETSVSEIETTCGVPVLAVVPDEVGVPASIAHRVPLVLYRPNDEAAQVFCKLAGVLINEKYKSKITLFSKFLKTIGLKDAPIQQPEVRMDENFRFLRRQTAGEREAMIYQEAAKEKQAEERIGFQASQTTSQASEAERAIDRPLPEQEPRQPFPEREAISTEKLHNLEGDMASLRRIKDLLDSQDLNLNSLESELTKVRKILLILEREYRQGLISAESYSELKQGNERKLEQIQQKMNQIKGQGNQNG
ncbi:MAG: cell division ATPase MinD [archaeon]